MATRDRGERIEVGVRDLRNNLSRVLAGVREGDEVIVTDHGKPVARILQIDAPTDRLAELAARGLVRPPTATGSGLPVRRVEAKGSVSDLVADQRR